MWKKAVVAYFRYYPGTGPKELRTIRKCPYEKSEPSSVRPRRLSCTGTLGPAAYEPTLAVPFRRTSGFRRRPPHVASLAFVVYADISHDSVKLKPRAMTSQLRHENAPGLTANTVGNRCSFALAERAHYSLPVCQLSYRRNTH
jgi:hypothetical protein